MLQAEEATAHAFLVTTAPQAGARLQASPPSLRLAFSEPVAGGERLVLKRLSGSRIAIGAIQRREGGRVIESVLPSLREGIYTVSWQAPSEDGHLSVGEFAFAVGRTGRLPALQSGDTGRIEWPQAAAGWLFVGGLLLAFGGLANERWVWSGVAGRHELVIPRLPVGYLLALSLSGGLLTLYLLARQSAAPEGLAGWRTLLLARPGLLALGQTALVAYGLWLMPVRRLRSWVLIPLALALALAAYRGHPGSVPAWWAAPANALHLGAVGFWAGGLAHLVLVASWLREEEARPGLLEGAGRYAGLALVSVGLLVATGILVALSQFADLAEVTGTSYGRILLIKIGLLTGALGLALTARRRGLTGKKGPHPGLLRRLTRFERAFVLGAVAAGVVLASTTPPRSLAATQSLLGPPPLEGPVVRRAGQVGFLSIYLAAAPDLLQIQALEPGGEPDPDVRLSLRGRKPDGKGLTISPRPCGPGCVSLAFPWQEGTTVLHLAASSPEWGRGRVRLEVPWPPGPEDPALFERVLATMRAQPRISMEERVTPGDSAGGRFPDLTGSELVALQPYAGGGVTDIRPVPGDAGVRKLAFYIPGSSIWVLFEIDDQDRLVAETIVSPGHLIQRRFAYPDGAE